MESEKELRGRRKEPRRGASGRPSKDSALREERGALLDAAERLREIKILNWAAVEAIGDFDRHSSGGTVGSQSCIAVRWCMLLSRACAQHGRLGCGWCCCWFASCRYAIRTDRTHRSRFCASVISMSPGSLRCSVARC